MEPLRFSLHPHLETPAQVLDARDPQGTRCLHLERHLRSAARHKHLLFLLNKCDLVRSPPSLGLDSLFAAREAQPLREGEGKQGVGAGLVMRQTLVRTT